MRYRRESTKFSSSISFVEWKARTFAGVLSSLIGRIARIRVIAIVISWRDTLLSRITGECSRKSLNFRDGSKDLQALINFYFGSTKSLSFSN